jgi:hypothetical protein
MPTIRIAHHDLYRSLRRCLTASCLALLATAAAAQTLDAHTPDAEPNAGRLELVGTWVATITPSDGETPPFHGFYTFNADGNASFSSAGPPLPALGNPGYGVWQRTGPRTFIATFVQNTYTADLQFDGTLEIRAAIRLTGRNSFSTEDEVEIFAPDGELIVTLGGSAQAQRLVARGPSGATR